MFGEKGKKLPAEGRGLIMTQKRGQEQEARILGNGSKGRFSQKGQPNAHSSDRQVIDKQNLP